AAGASGAPTSRKPFVVFQFEVTGPSPAAAMSAAVGAAIAGAPPTAHKLPTAQELSPWAELEGPRAEELQRPLAGSVAGRWRATDAGPGAPEDALYCLEVHGDEVRPSLASEARQLFFCYDAFDRAVHSSAPSLRVGRYYQRGLWQRILADGLLSGGGSGWAAMMAQDHFEIVPMRRNNPQSAEPPDWRFKLRVLSTAGVTLNYSVVCNAGDERELSQSDTLTVSRAMKARNSSASPDCSAGGSSGSRSQGPSGLHFTFIPFCGSLSRAAIPTSSEELGSLSREVLAPEPARHLPELSDSEDDGGPLASQLPGRGKSVGSPLPAECRAGALRPPTSVLLPESPRDAISEDSQKHSPEATARILRPPSAGSAEGTEPDDLFARTGFRSTVDDRPASGADDEVLVFQAPQNS
ncbi:unnamed protein product, partial [Polarella glacialis]